MSILVPLLLAVPLLSAVVVAMRGPNNGPIIRAVSLVSTLLSLVLAVAVTAAFLATPPPAATPGPPTFHPTLVFKEMLVPLGPGPGPSGSSEASVPGLQFYVGIDGLNVWLVLLTALLMVTAVLISWTAVTERVNEFYAWLLVLQLGMQGVFLAFDIVLFYVFFELSLVPLFFLIGIWGGPQRQYAARKFFIYTLAGSLITLLGVLGVVVSLAGQGPSTDGPGKKLTFEIPELVKQVGEDNLRRTKEVQDRQQSIATAKADVQRLTQEIATSKAAVPKAVTSQAAAAATTWALAAQATYRQAVAGGPIPEVLAAWKSGALKGQELKSKQGSVARMERELAARLEQVPIDEKDLKERRRALAQLPQLQFWMFLAMAFGFAIKVPLVPLHTWLPLAHVEAPTAGSVLLAGVLLKIGSYGFLRLCVPLAPDTALAFGAPLIATLAVIGIIYGSFCALAQRDIKKLVAYSSVGHLGYCMLGMFALNEVGLSGSLLQMINHGLSTGALFLLVGMIYERYHTREMDKYGGLGARLRILAVFFVFITLSSIGLPGLNGFIGELLVMMGTASTKALVHAGALTVLAALGIILGAWYMLTLVRRVFFGPVKEPRHHGERARDLNGREWATLVPIALCCLALGVFPKPFLDSTAADVRVVAHIADGARERAKLSAPLTSDGRGDGMTAQTAGSVRP
jgi:NADH-quinone oxidoreductase subunit M